MVINKRRVWKGLMMVAFININHKFFFDRLIHGDKQTFSFGFNASDTAYALATHHQFPVGLVGTGQVGVIIAAAFVAFNILQDGREFFCSSTSAQRNPDTGAVLFMHRGATKFKWTYDYFQHVDPPRAWSVAILPGIDACQVSSSSPYNYLFPIYFAPITQPTTHAMRDVQDCHVSRPSPSTGLTMRCKASSRRRSWCGDQSLSRSLPPEACFWTASRTRAPIPSRPSH